MSDFGMGHGGGRGGTGGGMRPARATPTQQQQERPAVPRLGRRIWRLFDAYRGKLAVTAVLIVAAAGISVITPFLTQAVFDRGLFPPDGTPNLNVLAWLVAGMVVLPAIVSVLAVARTWLTTRIGNSVMADLRERLFTHLQKMDLAFFTGTKTGQIQSRLGNDVGGVQNVLTDTAASIVSNAVTFIAAVVAMFVLSWQLAIIALILLPVMVWLHLKVGNKRRAIAAEAQESLAEMTAITQESLSVSGIVLTKSFNRQAAEQGRYDRANRRQAVLQVRQQLAGQWFFAAVGMAMAITPAAVYLVAGLMISGNVALTAGTLVAFSTLQARLQQPVVSLLRVSVDVQTSLALFARIFEYLDLVPKIAEPESPVALEKVRGRITLDDVSFRYGGASSNAVSHVSIEVEPGSFVALVGPSGAGKTTLSYLIPRLYDATEGTVALDGVDVKKLSESTRGDAFGMVTQETYLFHDTIRANLAFAKPDASDDEIIASARAANIHDTIASFPDGYDTVVGERGYRLSGGEKQRVAIARVLLKNPAVLILDEATSALDTVSERLVQDAIGNVLTGRTTVAIAHRLSTIRHADRIYVVDGGQIAESGTHEELVAAGGLYARLDAIQTSQAPGSKAPLPRGAAGPVPELVE